MRPLKAGLCRRVRAVCVGCSVRRADLRHDRHADGQPLKDADIEIKCGEEAPLKGKTAADGAYRINVPQQGQCSLTLPTYTGDRRQWSFPRPIRALYNFQLVVKDAEGKFELRRRQ